MTPTLTHSLLKTGERNHNNNNISSASTFTTSCRSNKAQLPNSAKEQACTSLEIVSMENSNGQNHMSDQHLHQQHQHQKEKKDRGTSETDSNAAAAGAGGDGGGGGGPVASTLVKINGNPVDVTSDGTTASGAVVSQTKDLSKFKRDYYVPNCKQHEEALNAVDEKVRSNRSLIWTM